MDDRVEVINARLGVLHEVGGAVGGAACGLRPAAWFRACLGGCSSQGWQLGEQGGKHGRAGRERSTPRRACPCHPRFTGPSHHSCSALPCPRPSDAGDAAPAAGVAAWGPPGVHHHLVSAAPLPGTRATAATGRPFAVHRVHCWEGLVCEAGDERVRALEPAIRSQSNPHILLSICRLICVDCLILLFQLAALLGWVGSEKLPPAV